MQNTHMYLACKAMQLARESISNTVDEGGAPLTGSRKAKERLAAKELQHRLRYYDGFSREAAWAPDAVLKDMNPYHVFKLVTQEEFPHHDFGQYDRIERGGVTYCRFSGGLPYRVDHIAQDIISMCKLRDFNDQFTLRQIIYHYLLMSHYLVDAHVPMHCDLRDDPPAQNDGGQKPQGRYMDKNAHKYLEALWDSAVSRVAIGEGIISQTLVDEAGSATEYDDQVRLTLGDCARGGAIRSPTIARGGLMTFMIDVCVESKKRCLRLFPLDDPENRDDTILPQMTREIFTTCVADLIAVWRYIWSQCQTG